MLRHSEPNDRTSVMSSRTNAEPIRLAHRREFQAHEGSLGPQCCGLGHSAIPGVLAESEESQNREYHDDHADQPEYVVHEPPTQPRRDTSPSRRSEAAHMRGCAGRLPSAAAGDCEAGTGKGPAGSTLRLAYSPCSQLAVRCTDPRPNRTSGVRPLVPGTPRDDQTRRGQRNTVTVTAAT